MKDLFEVKKHNLYFNNLLPKIMSSMRWCGKILYSPTVHSWLY